MRCTGKATKTHGQAWTWTKLKKLRMAYPRMRRVGRPHPQEETVHPEEEWNELHDDREVESDPWAIVGMDDAEAVLLEASGKPCAKKKMELTTWMQRASGLADEDPSRR